MSKNFVDTVRGLCIISPQRFLQRRIYLMIFLVGHVTQYALSYMSYFIPEFRGFFALRNA